MAYKYYKIIQTLTNNELIQILKKNNYDFEEILAEKQTTGKELLALSEMDLITWALAPRERKKLWSCIKELKLNSKFFFENSQEPTVGEFKPAGLRKNSFTAPKSENLVTPKDNTVRVPSPLSDSSRKPPKPLPEPPQLEKYDDLDRDHDDYENLCQINVPDRVRQNEPSPSLKQSKQLPRPPPLNYLKHLVMETHNYYNSDDNEPLPESPTECSAMEKPNHSDSDYKEDEYVCPADEPSSSLEFAKNKMEHFVASKPNALRKNDFSEKLEQVLKKPQPAGVPAAVARKPPKPLPEEPLVMEKPKYKDNDHGEDISRLIKKNEPNENKTRIDSPTEWRGVLGQNRKLPLLPPEEIESPEPIYHNQKLPPEEINSSEPIYHNQDTYKSDSKNKISEGTPIFLNRSIGHSYEDFLFSPNLPRHPPVSLINRPNLEKNNFNNERFFRNTDRKGARDLLKGLPDGAFLFRPSSKFFLGLSLKYRDKISNLGVKTTEKGLKLAGDEGEGSPTFASLSDLEQYFTQHPILFSDQGYVRQTCLKHVLPDDRF